MRPVVISLLTAAAVLSPAASAHAADACPNAQFRTGAGASLPECRAWEQVSPVQKQGINVFEKAPIFAADDRVAFEALGSFGDVDSAPAVGTYLARRDAAAWTTRGVDPPSLTIGVVYAPTLDYSDDHRTALVTSLRRLTDGAVEGDTNLYLRDLDTGGYRFVARVPGPAAFDQLSSTNRIGVVAESADLRHFAVQSYAQLTADAPADGPKLYQWDGDGLRLASLLPDGSVPENGAATPRLPREAFAYSRDGRRLTMLLGAFGPGGEVLSRLYQRIDGETTTLIGRSHRAGTDQTAPASVASSKIDGPWSSSDGSQVTFADAFGGPLTDRSPSDGQNRLYRWHADGDRLEDLLAGLTDVAQTNVALRRVSRDQRFVWFTSPFALTADAPASGGLYVLDTTRRQLSYTFGTDGFYSPDGTRVVIASDQPLTGFDNAVGQCPTSGCSELFSFDATAPEAGVVCASCGLPGAGAFRAGYRDTDFEFAGVVPRAVTDDGRVFFDTPSALVAADVNTVADVYQFTPGVGLTLLSGGTSDRPARFADSDPTGRDVYFTTADRLVAQDTDDLIDLYDARAGGGLAAQRDVPAFVPPCSGDGCRPDAPTAPPRPSPATPAEAARPAPTFRVLAPSKAARRAAARRGRLTVRVRVSTAGRLGLRARARIAGRTRRVASTSKRASRASTVAATLRLSARARAKLRRGRSLRLAVTATFSPVPRARTVSVTLKRPSSSSRGGSR